MEKLTLNTIRKQARYLGATVDKNATKTDLIRAIQAAEGNYSCFATPLVTSCGQENCCWRGDCLKSATC
jgi:hypothetical protein